jgi:hypothetical protein
MKKVARIIKKGEDNSNYLYWLTLTPLQRLIELQKLRLEVNKHRYADSYRKRLQRVCRVVKHA